MDILEPAPSAGARPRRRRLACLTLLAVTLLTPCRVLAQAPTEAGVPDASNPDVTVLLRRGLQEYRKKDFAAAHATLEEAWRMKPHADLAAALAEVEMKLQLFREAAEHWEYYLDHTQTSREQAASRLEECQERLAALRLSVEPPHARVFLDDRLLERSALDLELWLEPGVHSLYATYDGRSSPTQTIELAAGQRESAVISVPPPPIVPPRPVVVAKTRPAPLGSGQSPGESALRPALLIAEGGLTLAALGVGVAYSLRAQALHGTGSELRAEVLSMTDPALVDTSSSCTSASRPPACAALARNARGQLDARRIALGSFVSAGVFGIATVATYFLWPTSKRSTGSARLVFVPSNIGRGGELELIGHW